LLTNCLPFLQLKKRHAELCLNLNPRDAETIRALLTELNRKGPSVTREAGWFARRVGDRWLTPQQNFIDPTGFTEFSETWPRSGLMRNGIAYQLPPLVRLTDEIGSGLWATPMPSDVDGGRTTKGKHRQSETGLRRQVMWPTMTARDRHTLAKASRGAGSLERGQQWVPSLVVAAHMWPTPAERDYRHPNAKPYSERGGGKKGEQLPNAVGGSLNPMWVEWLMGFPLGFTDLGR
jgi:hypothetical protein